MSCTCTGLNRIVGWHSAETMSRQPNNVDADAADLKIEAERHNMMMCMSYFPVLGIFPGLCLAPALYEPSETYSYPAKVFACTRAMLACAGVGVACSPVDAVATCYFCYYQQNATAAGNAGCLSSHTFCCLQPQATTSGGDTASQNSATKLTSNY